MPIIHPTREVLVSRKFDDILASQLVTLEDGEAISTTLTVVGKSGEHYDVPYNQLMLLMGVILADHNMLENVGVLQHLLSVAEYDPTDLGKYVANKYTATISSSEQRVQITANLVHQATLPDHPDYDPDLQAKPKELDLIITEFGLFHQLALAALISKLSPDLTHVRGTYNTDYRFVWENGTILVEPIRTV